MRCAPSACLFAPGHLERLTGIPWTFGPPPEFLVLGGGRNSGRRCIVPLRAGFHVRSHDAQPPISIGPAGALGLRMKKISGAHTMHTMAMAKVASAYERMTACPLTMSAN